MPWRRILECYLADHNGHTGCSEFMWLSDVYDEILCVLCLAIIVALLVSVGWVTFRDESAARDRD
jgi:hypothetical protein